MAYSFSLFAGQQGSTVAIDGVTIAASMSTAGVLVDRTCVLAPDGNIYFIDGFSIRKLSITGKITTIAGVAATPGYTDAVGILASFTNPKGIAVDNSGNIYITEQSNFTIRKITPDGTVTTWIGVNGSQNTTEGAGAVARFFNPLYLCYDGNNTLFVIDNFRIRQITISTATIAALAGSNGSSGVTDGTGVAARFNFAGGANGGALWWQSARGVLVAMNPNNALTLFQVREITVPGGVVTTPTMTGSAFTFGGGIYGANCGFNGLYGTSTGYVNTVGHLFTVTFSAGSYSVTDDNLWSSHVGAGAAVRSNVIPFGGGFGIFGRESSTGGSNGILFEVSGTPVNGISANPSGGMNIDGASALNELVIVNLSGIYSLDSTKTHDTYQNTGLPNLALKIPNPFGKTGFIGG